MTTFERTVAIVGIGLAILTAALFYRQLNEMTSQTQILASQSEGANAGALMDEMNTRKQLAIVQKQVAAAEKQVRILGKAFNSLERPYVGVDRIDNSNDKSAKTMGVTAYIKNFGSNPAENVLIRRHWYYMGQELVNQIQPPGRSGTIYPGVTRSLTETMTNIWFDKLKMGDFWVRVEITYAWQGQKYNYCEEFNYAPIPPEIFTERGSCAIEKSKN